MATEQTITWVLPLDAANFVLASLDRNPLQNSVMQTANLIRSLTEQTQQQTAASQQPDTARARAEGPAVQENSRDPELGGGES